MQLGAVPLWGKDLALFRRGLRVAEEVGCDVIGIGDSPGAWHDLVVSLTIAAYETQSARVMPMVTGPILRHPAVLAGSMCSLDELTGGRAALGISTGGSGLRTIGHRKANVEELRQYLEAVRSLCAGDSIVWEGCTVKALRTARPMPIYMAADGPKAVHLAGEIADGVVISVGADMDLVEEKIGWLREGAELAGRDVGELEIWGLAFGSARDTYEEAVQDVKAFLAVNAVILRPRWAMERVPEEYRGRLRELFRRYEVSEHVVAGGKNAQLVDELGLTDFLAGQNAIVGTPDSVKRTADELESRGVTRLICPMPDSDPEGILRRFASAVLAS